MVRHYWASKGQPDKQVIISRQRLPRFHRGGRQPGRHEGDARPGRIADPGIVHIDQPYHFGEGQG